MIIYTAQELSVYQFTPSSRILVAGWCLAAFVSVQSYTCCLVSYLMAPKFIPFANTIGELANSNELTFVVLKYTAVETDMAVSNCSPNISALQRLELFTGSYQ